MEYNTGDNTTERVTWPATKTERFKFQFSQNYYIFAIKYFEIHLVLKYSTFLHLWRKVLIFEYVILVHYEFLLQGDSVNVDYSNSEGSSEPTKLVSR